MFFFNWLDTVEIDCDAPCYRIVETCRGLGFQAPEDVRWGHVGNAPRSAASRLKRWSWKALFQGSELGPAVCVCGGDLPELDRCTFSFSAEEVIHLFMGQCGRCRTIWWREAEKPLHIP